VVFQHSGKVTLNAQGVGRVVHKIGTQPAMIAALPKTSSFEALIVATTAGEAPFVFRGVTQLRLGKLQTSVAPCQAGAGTQLNVKFQNPLAQQLDCTLSYTVGSVRSGVKVPVTIAPNANFDQNVPVKCSYKAGKNRGLVRCRPPCRCMPPRAHELLRATGRSALQERRHRVGPRLLRGHRARGVAPEGAGSHVRQWPA
jgi:hypothetical protein